MRPEPAAIAAYYRAAVLGLRALETREGRHRRFGPDADERWRRYVAWDGAPPKLHDGDRLQVLLRDAAAPWPLAFSATRIFRLPAVATDEPFGPAWDVPEARRAADLLATDEPATLHAVCRALGVERALIHVPELHPGTRLCLAGGSAIRAAAEAFAGRDDLDWSAQVTVVADAPAHRQLAGLASVLLGAVRPCSVPASDEDAPHHTPVIGPDAEPACAAALR